jgi:curved DNA-binding protein
MQFKDYYAALGVERSADTQTIKRAYRRLARKYHPDVSNEPDAEARFKEVAEAYEALSDPEKRAAYDQVSQRWSSGAPPPDWDAGFEFSGRDAGAGDGADFSEFFEALFGRRGGVPYPGHGRDHARSERGEDHHAKLLIEIEDAYRGARRSITLRVPELSDGRVIWRERQLDVDIPKGIRSGQHLRLSGQGSPGHGSGPAGDLYLEVEFRPHRVFRVDGRDVVFDLPVAPWEAALGTTVLAPTPEGSVELRVPPNSPAGRRLRLKGRGLPGSPAGDLYAVLAIAMPAAASEAQQQAWRTLAAAFDFKPRAAMEG